MRVGVRGYLAETAAARAATVLAALAGRDAVMPDDLRY